MNGSRSTISPGTRVTAPLNILPRLINTARRRCTGSLSRPCVWPLSLCKSNLRRCKVVNYMFFGWLKRKEDHRTPRQILGARGEKAAAKHLRRNGYKILLKNFRSKKAEVDIVARHKDWLVFVEVKTRQTEQFGAPNEAVQRGKQLKSIQAPLHFPRMFG